ncbi:DNA cytosine methyltransferase [Polluticoccus soli]|uniref:DNA cytosine methyltransferase n=1 Tax=Polluticoccus soli TaxID=3034150 RepID=UPI0023E1A808|nr:DNA cytosine methyltransferase [Flavipsychrobacter sp. JY13-12]
MKKSIGLKIKRIPILIGFYSGLRCGEVGAERAGWKNIFSCDIQPTCADVFFQHNDEGLYLVADATQLTGKNVYEYIVENGQGELIMDGIDCVLSTSSCKAISRSNNYDMSLSPDAYCFVDQLRLIDEIHPATFVIENVDGVDDVKNRWLMAEFEMRLRSMKDYIVISAVLDASEYGARQIRKRLIVIGVRKDLDIMPSFPAPSVPDYSKVSFKALFPYLDGFASGQSVKRYKSSDTQMFVTLTAHDDTWTFENGNRRQFRSAERLKLVEMEHYCLDHLPIVWQKSLPGNALPPSLAKAIFGHLKDEVLYKSPTWK